MSTRGHRIYIYSLTAIVVVVSLYLIFQGSSYYVTATEERFYHPDHAHLKPSGFYGHGLGIIGTLLIIIGVFGYMARKRFKSLSRLGVLKHWLEFHIFLCTLGPIMVLFHTSFKFGGIVSISFWSMVAVVASGVIGRFIYLQIPRTIQGRELSLHEIHDMQTDLESVMQNNFGNLSVNIHDLIHTSSSANQNDFKGFNGIFKQYADEFRRKKQIRTNLKNQNISSEDINVLMKLVSNEMALTRKIQRLVTMQRLFRYWHIAHLPFALIMLIIMIIHVAVSLTFGYTWIF
jgi:hypothetical protein